MITISESSTPEVIITQSTDVLLETVVAPASVIETAADSVVIVAETATTEVVTTSDPGDTIVEVEEVPVVIETPAEQGPQGVIGLTGPPGPAAASYPGKTLNYTAGVLTDVYLYSDAAKTTLVEHRVLIRVAGVLTSIEFYDGTATLVKTRTLTYTTGLLTGVVDA